METQNNENATSKEPVKLHPNALHRIPYFEIREAEEVQKKGDEEAHKVLTFQIRERCRAEIDEYVDCAVDRFWTLWKCKPAARAAQKCIRQYNDPAYLVNKQRQILAEREQNNQSVLRLRERSKYNRFIEHPENNWVPTRAKDSSNTCSANPSSE